jgi:hypothetical protein
MEWWGALGLGVLGVFLLAIFLVGLFFVPSLRKSRARVYYSHESETNRLLVRVAASLHESVRPTCCLANQHVSSIHSVVKPALLPPTVQ